MSARDTFNDKIIADLREWRSRVTTRTDLVIGVEELDALLAAVDQRDALKAADSLPRRVLLDADSDEYKEGYVIGQRSAYHPLETSTHRGDPLGPGGIGQ